MSGNAAVSLVYPSAAATVHVAGDGSNITGQKTDVAMGDRFNITGLGKESSHTPALGDEKCTPGDGHVRAGVDLPRIPGPVPATTADGERGSGGNGRRVEKEEGSDDRKEEKTATAKIGEFLARLPLSKLKIIIGEKCCFVGSGVEFLYPLLSLKKGILLSYYHVTLLIHVVIA